MFGVTKVLEAISSLENRVSCLIIDAQNSLGRKLSDLQSRLSQDNVDILNRLKLMEQRILSNSPAPLAIKTIGAEKDSLQGISIPVKKRTRKLGNSKFDGRKEEIIKRLQSGETPHYISADFTSSPSEFYKWMYLHNLHLYRPSRHLRELNLGKKAGRKLGNSKFDGSKKKIMKRLKNGESPYRISRDFTLHPGEFYSWMHRHNLHQAQKLL